MPLDWINSLTIGFKVDAVKTEKVGNTVIEGWAPGVVKEISLDTITIEFNYMSTMYIPYLPISKVFKKDSKEVAPEKYKIDWDWRFTLKENTEIDIADIHSHWYKGTIIERHNGDYVTIGYRVYSPINQSIYEGYDSTHDEKISIHSLRIQKAGLIAKEGKIYCSNYLDKEYPKIDDNKDILLNNPIEGDNLYVVYRKGKCTSSFYLSLMNDFGKEFNNIIKHCRENTIQMQEMFDYIDLISAAGNLYHRKYVIEWISPFVKLVLDYISKVPIEQLKNITRKSIDKAITQLEVLMRRVFTSRTKKEELIKLKIELAMKLLHLDSLELRIEAVALIASIYNSLKNLQVISYYAEAYSYTKTLLKSLINVPKVIEEVFGKKSHLELIRRSTEMLRVFLLDEEIGKSEFKVIWSCCNNEQSKIETLKVISEAAGLLSKEVIELIAEEYKNIPKTSFKDQDILMLNSLLEKNIKASPYALQRIIEIIWEVINDGIEGISIEVKKEAVNKFCRAIASSDTQILENWFIQLYIMLEKAENIKLVLKILRTSLFQLQLLPIYKTKAEMILDFLNKGNVIHNFFNNITQYTINSSFISNLNKEEHREHLNEMIEFLLFIIRTANYKLSGHDLEILWKNFVVTPVLNEDQEVFYKFLSNLVLFVKLESMKDLSDFFVSTMCNGSFKELTQEGVEAIESLLIAVNKNAGLLEDAKKGSQRLTPLWKQIRAHIFKKGEDNFIVKKRPDKIKGINILWKIVLESKRESVSLKAMELLNKLYTRLAVTLDSSLAEISKEFIETAIEKLSLFYQKTIQENKDKEIVTLIRVIQEMLDESERKGNHCITPLYAINKGMPIKIIVTESNMTFNLDLHSNFTLYQLKALVAGRLKVFPENVIFDIKIDSIVIRQQH